MSSPAPVSSHNLGSTTRVLVLLIASIGFLFDTYELLMTGGEDGPVIDPGKPDASEIIRRVSLPGDDDDFMPNDGKKPLTPSEIQLIGQWIAAGAKGG